MEAVFIDIAENPNCPEWAGQVFQPRTELRAVSQVRRERGGEERWFDITGLRDDGQPCSAMACLIDDSGEGSCYLVFGGAWGLRLKEPARGDGWALEDSAQWGEPFLLLSGDGSDLRFE